MATFKEKIADLKEKINAVDKEKRQQHFEVERARDILSRVREEFRLMELKVHQERLMVELAETKKHMFETALTKTEDVERVKSLHKAVSEMESSISDSNKRLRQFLRDIDEVGSQHLDELEAGVEKRLEMLDSYDSPAEEAVAYELYLTEKLALLERLRDVAKTKAEMVEGSTVFTEKEKQEKLESYQADAQSEERSIEIYTKRLADVGKEGFVDGAGPERKTVEKESPGLSKKKWDEWMVQREVARENEDWKSFHETLQSQAQALHDIEKTLEDKDRKRFEEIKSKIFEAKCPLTPTPGMTPEEKRAQLEELTALDDARERYRTGEPLTRIPDQEKEKNREVVIEKPEYQTNNAKVLEANDFLYREDFKFLTLDSTLKSLRGDFKVAAETIFFDKAESLARLRTHDGSKATVQLSDRDIRLGREAVREHIRAQRRLDHLNGTFSGKLYKVLMPDSHEKDCQWALKTMSRTETVMNNILKRGLKVENEEKDEFERMSRKEHEARKRHDKHKP